METKNYDKEKRFDPATVEALKLHYAEILRLLGEDPAREGLLKTPERVAKAMAFLTKGYDENPLDIIRSAMCMQMRGIEKQQSATTTSAFTGVFLSSQRTREEFMTLISHRYR